MYDFLTGPAVWISFTIFIVGLIVRLTFLYGLSKGRDPMLYNHVDGGWGFKSVFYWLLPLGSVSLRQQPVFSIMVFLFHVGLLSVPLFLNGHNSLLQESFGISLPSFPDPLADGLTIMVMGTGLFLLIRRLVRPEVRILTGFWDYAVLLLTLFPFVTGFLAYQQWGPYETIFILHVLTAEILLILIPFTKLSHMVLFFFTRAFIGFEMGTRRGAHTW